MNKLNGSALVQYAIILSLLSIGVISVYMFFGQQINAILNSYLKVFTQNSEKVAVNADIISSAPSNVSANTSMGGSMGGTSTNPTQSCTTGSCSIDFGNFVLNGIPENYADYVKNNGSSGGTEKLATIFEQIAQTLQNQGDIAGAAQYRDMANLGHILSDTQKIVESQAQQCVTNSNPTACLKQKVTTQAIHPRVISSVSDKLSAMYANTNLNSEDIICNSFSDYIERAKVNNEDISYKLTYSPQYQIMTIYDQIMSNSNYSQNLKNVTTELLSQMNDTEQNFINTIGNLCYEGVSNYGHGNFDIITGELQPGSTSITALTDLNLAIHPETSNITNLDSTLVCVAGHNNDTNNTCHK